MATSRTTGHTNGHHQSSREVHQEINRIRDEMDHTLEEIGDYLHPKHLLDYAVDAVRSGSAGGSKQKVREAVNYGVRELKQHPGPALLLGGAALWYLMEHREGEDEPRLGRGSRRAATYGAWEEGYDWSTASEDEQSWSEKAREALDHVRTVIADTGMAAKDKVKAVANKMVGVSGKSREEIHAQWANLREHAGSFVDARTGEPYDDSYCEPWCSSSLEACAKISEESEDDSSWSGKAQQAVSSMASSLKNTGASAKEQLRTIGGYISSLASGASAQASRATSRSRERVSRGLHSAAGSAQQGIHRVGDVVQQGLGRGQDQFKRALEEKPFAVGAACLGLGLLVGLLAPSTRQENELLGDAADRLKDQAREAGEQVVDRGKEVASAAASAVSDVAERQGVTPAKLGETARSMACDR
jgi:ElaB/YqjD/DUF883 family membrane-anchored ribosome-binding protein